MTSHIKLLSILVSFLMTASCEDVDVNLFKDDVYIGSWDEVFINRKDVTPLLPDSMNPLGNIRSIDIYDSNLVVPDGMNGRILIVNENNRVVSAFGRNGQGPGEFQLLSSISTGSTGTIWAFDVNGYRVVKYALLDDVYKPYDEFKLNNTIIQLKQHESRLISYSLATPTLISVYDSAGVHVGSSFEVMDEDLRKRMVRFQGGGIDVASDGLIYVISPLEFAIFIFDSDLNAVDTLRWEHQSKWRPSVPDPPPDSSPYGFTNKDRKWWNSFLHIGRLHLVSSEYLLVWLYEEDQSEGLSQYINIYSIRGDVLAEGIDVPKGEYVIGARNGVIYTAKDAHMSNGGLNDNVETGYRLNDASIYQYQFFLEQQIE